MGIRGGKMGKTSRTLAVCLLALHPAGPSLGKAPEVSSASPAYLTLAELQRRYRLPTSRFVMLDGHSIHYTDQGRGSVIVLLHGSSSSLRTYDRVVPLLARNHRVIRFDQSNMGLSSPPPPALFGKPLYPVTVLESLLSYLKVDKATLVGVSSGGAIAFFFAARHPDKVERLILSNTPVGRADGAGMALSRDLARELAASTPTAGRSVKIYRPLSYWKAYFTFYTGEPDRMTSAMIDQYFDMNRRPPAPDRLAVVDALDDADATKSALASITAPTLLIWGLRDPVLPQASMRKLADGLNHTQVSTMMMPDVGHYPPLEAPERFAQIVATYVDATTPVKPVAPPPAER